MCVILNHIYFTLTYILLFNYQFLCYLGACGSSWKTQNAVIWINRICGSSWKRWQFFPFSSLFPIFFLSTIWRFVFVGEGHLLCVGGINGGAPPPPLNGYAAAVLLRHVAYPRYAPAHGNAQKRHRLPAPTSIHQYDTVSAKLNYFSKAKLWTFTVN